MTWPYLWLSSKLPRRLALNGDQDPLVHVNAQQVRIVFDECRDGGQMSGNFMFVDVFWVDADLFEVLWLQDASQRGDIFLGKFHKELVGQLKSVTRESENLIA